MEYKIIAINTTETPIEQPKKNKNNINRGKKQYTLKTQVVADKKTKRIICTAFGAGKAHDFNLFKKSELPISCQKIWYCFFKISKSQKTFCSLFQSFIWYL